MNRERPAGFLVLWSGIASILVVGIRRGGGVVDAFALTAPPGRGRISTSYPAKRSVLMRNRSSWTNRRRSPVHRATALDMSATQAYLDSLSGFSQDPAPALTSFAQTAAIFSDYDFTDAATFAVVVAEGDYNGAAVDSLSYVVDGEAVVNSMMMDMPSAQYVADAAVDAVVSAPAVAAVAGVESMDAVVAKEDLWGLGSTVFENTASAASSSSPAVGARSAAQDTIANYWDSVVMKGVVNPWYEAAKAKQEELAATLLSEQNRELAVSNLLPKTNPLEGFGESLSNSFQSVSLPKNLPEIPSLSKLADASLVDIFTAIGSTLATIARGFWYVLTALVEFVTGGRSNLGDITNQIKYSIDSTMTDALDTVRSSLYDLGQVTLQEAVVFLVQVVFRFVELLFTLVSSVCQAFTGQGLDVWLQSIGTGLSEQAILATQTLSSTVHDLSHASLTELAVILSSYAVAVARVLVDSPKLLADAFTSSGAADLVQSTMTAVESTTSLLGSTGGSF
jgi:hypothetical protein